MLPGPGRALSPEAHPQFSDILYFPSPCKGQRGCRWCPTRPSRHWVLFSEAVTRDAANAEGLLGGWVPRAGSHGGEQTEQGRTRSARQPPALGTCGHVLSQIRKTLGLMPKQVSLIRETYV